MFLDALHGRFGWLLGYGGREAACDAGTAFDIYPFMTHSALDMITECACGEVGGRSLTSTRPAPWDMRAGCAHVNPSPLSPPPPSPVRWSSERG
jgi:hypothetical protein